MKRVLIIQGKGGGPKTATCRNLAVAAAVSGWRVATIDTDPQATLTHWHSARPKDVVAIAGEQRPLFGISGPPPAVDDEEVQFIDTPTAVEFFPEATQILFAAADLVVLPVRPGPEDLLSVRDMMPFLRSRRRPMLFVLSLVKANSRAAREAREDIAALGGTLARVEIPALKEVPDSFKAGLGTAEVPRTRTGPLFQALWSDIAERVDLVRELAK